MSTQQEVAAHLDLSSRRVRQMIADGIFPAGKGSGGLNLDDCRVAYVRYLRGLSSGQVRAQAASTGDIKDPREAFEYERWREKKRQNDLEEDLVAPVSLLTMALAKAASQIIPIMDSLPLEMKRRNPQLSGHDIMLVKKSIAKCRKLSLR